MRTLTVRLAVVALCLVLPASFGACGGGGGGGEGPPPPSTFSVVAFNHGSAAGCTSSSPPFHGHWIVAVGYRSCGSVSPVFIAGTIVAGIGPHGVPEIGPGQNAEVVGIPAGCWDIYVKYDDNTNESDRCLASPCGFEPSNGLPCVTVGLGVARPDITYAY